jgi:hypothetical protein
MKINQGIQTPVFLDNLPDVINIHSRHSTPYRLKREQQLISLLMDETLTWHDNDCPTCGPQAKSKHFLLGRLPFHRCQRCNTIHAAKVPDQKILDGLRCDLAETTGAAEERSQRNLEWTSILNWIHLSSARYRRVLAELVDYRFNSHAPGFAEAVAMLGNHERRWRHVPVPAKDTAAEPFADLVEALKARPTQAVLIQADIDRCQSPRRLLQTLKDSLQPGALVFISTSCADGLEYEILGAESPSFVALDRLNLFSVKGFQMLAQEIGFKCLELSTPGRLDAVILKSYFNEPTSNDMPFWSSFFKEANRDRLQDLQLLLQRSLRSGFMRVVLEV